MSYEAIEYGVEDAVAVITFNRPEQLNALNATLLQEFRRALEDAAADDAVRAVLVRATGRAFSSGADLKEGFDSGMDTATALRTNYHPVVQAMRSIEKPVIAAVQGLAAGAGASMALAADMIIAAESASFQQIFTNIGLVPDAGSTYMLPRLVGRARALGAVLTGEAVPAAEAERWGMIWKVVPDAELDDAARELAGTLAARPTRALGLAKRILDEAEGNDLATQLELEAETQLKVQGTADFAEAVQAFLQKRKPEFVGR
ncbi:enoyl-CoA hydratase [Salinisphaera sp. PC39]|uniref:enoyl-CoA hydratase-related protein n=1 Tax=Salinisphaera sp. PC39 TaxID=1304156 RepID=UPI00333E7B6F